jgi:hypothetical protein
MDLTSRFPLIGLTPKNRNAVFPGEEPNWAMDDMDCISAANTLIAKCALSSELYADLKEAKRQRIYVFGIVDYKDAFGDPHYTPFCYSRDKDAGVSEKCPFVKPPT